MTTPTRDELLKLAREALQFYADGSHFVLHDPDAWDTVSGEPQNFQEDESNTATVEDGSVAKQALAALLCVHQAQAEPSGYAYCYPGLFGDGTVLRFNSGREVNGCEPIEAVPYWFAPPSSDQTWNEAIEAAVEACRTRAQAFRRVHCHAEMYASDGCADAIRTIARPSQAQAPSRPCQNAEHMGEHACTNRHQCWEPCGELGHSAEHARVAQPVSGAADEREAFEAVLRAKWSNIALGRLQRDPEKYALEQVDFAWLAWQARAALSRTQQAPVVSDKGEIPIAPNSCPITGRKFWGNIRHPELGMVATYGGPFDTYTIPSPDEDGDLRCERFDQDRGEWIEGGEPIGKWLADEQPAAAPAQPVERQELSDVTRWISVEDRLPDQGISVLACYRTSRGLLRQIRAEWILGKTVEADGDSDAASEYDEKTDTTYIVEGWYEKIDNWGDYSSVHVTEGRVECWMPLPPSPADSAADRGQT